jgi:hypothetical protein
MNPWEEKSRAEKTRKIVAAIDSELGPATHQAPEGIVRWLRSLDAQQWEQVGILAKVLPPSETTQSQVIRVFEWRAEKIRRGTPPVIVGPAIEKTR